MRVYPKAYCENLPDFLAVAHDLPSADEMETARKVRLPFLFEGDKEPYMLDMVRALRLVKNARTYIEVGTYDKGCLAYVSTLLAPDAHLIDVDIEARPAHSRKLQGFLRPSQRLSTVVGDSTGAEALSEVEAALDGAKADVIFIDGNHAAAYAWADFVNFGRLLKPGGTMLFHDVYWLGAPDCFGVSLAMEWIDKKYPVHVVFADHPVHRFFPSMDKMNPVWGGVGIVRP